MSVLIKGMEIPKSCPCELIGTGYDLLCSFVGGVPARVKEYYECCQNNTRPSWCPLVPVPPHGRCIDADALIAHCKEIQSIERNNKASPYSWAYAYENFESDIEDAPTILEAEESE